MRGLNAALHADNGVDLEGRLMKKKIKSVLASSSQLPHFSDFQMRREIVIFERIIELTPKCSIQSWLWPAGVLHAKCGLIWKVRKTSRFSYGSLCHFKNIHLTHLGSMGIIVYNTRKVLR